MLISSYNPNELGDILVVITAPDVDDQITKIADDVALNTYGVFDQNKVAFLTDYNYDKHRGDLDVYNGKETVRVDSDVTSIIY